MTIRKMIAQFVGAGALIVLSAGSAYANLLANPDFDLPDVGAGDTGCSTGWTCFNNVFTVGDENFAIPANSGVNGQALKVFGSGGNGAFQEFAASPGDIFTGSAYVLNDSNDPMGGGMTAAVNLEWLGTDDGMGGVIVSGNGSFFCENGDCTAAPSNVWTQLEVFQAVAPAGTTGVRFVVVGGDFNLGGPSGAPKFDTAFLDQVVVPVPAAVWLFGSGLVGLVGVARRRKG